MMSDGWRVKDSDGREYGPLTETGINRWVTECRITRDSQILQPGSKQWQWAAGIFPSLPESAPEPEPIASEIAPASGIASSKRTSTQPNGLSITRIAIGVAVGVLVAAAVLYFGTIFYIRVLRHL